MPRGRKPKTVDEVKLETPLPESAIPAAKKASEKKKPAKKAEKVMKESIILQTAGVEWDVGAVKERILAAYVAEGHRKGRISELTVYLKPEERKAYYVVNNKTTGSIDIE